MSVKQPTMNNPYLYSVANNFQNSIALDIIPKYIKLMELKDNESFTVIDIGSATGYVTWVYLRPHLPRGTKIVSSDIQPKMLKYAKEHYPEMQYVQLNIVASEIPKCMIYSYDHVFSFSCLQLLLPEQKQAFENMYKMLKPGGSIFTYYPSSHLYMDVYLKTIELPKWKKYFNDVIKNANPFNDLSPLEIEHYLKDIINKIGFKITICKNIPKQYTYKDINEIRDEVTAVHPYYNKVPHELRSSFIDDVMEVIKLHENTKFTSNEIVTNYFLIIIIASKPFSDINSNIS